MKKSQNKSQNKSTTKRLKARSTVRSQVRKQLAEWSVAIRTRDKHVCALCGRSEHLNAHHILPKKFFPDVQFEMWNGISLCPKCHTFGKFSAHKNGVFFSEWLKHSRPEQYEEVVNHINVT